MKQVTTIVVLLLANVLESSQAYRNVFGKTLESCSMSGMALTGYTRTGYCVDRDDDAGSHHICIDLSSAQGGNFCEVTGQDDWCDSEMPCHDDNSQQCPIENWCVCQWAFASYLQNAGGCDQIQDIVCEAVNLEALKSYWKNNDTAKYETALNCIIERCGIGNELYKGAVSRRRNWLVGLGILVGVAACLALRWRRKPRVKSASQHQLLS